MPYADPVKRRENHQRYMREVWYPKNRKKHIERVGKRRKKIRLELANLLNNIKVDRGCIDCKIKDFRVLDFDHKKGSNKIFTISSARIRLLSVEKILGELEKCEVRCSNCHRIKTWERRNNAG